MNKREATASEISEENILVRFFFEEFIAIEMQKICPD